MTILLLALACGALAGGSLVLAMRALAALRAWLRPSIDAWMCGSYLAEASECDARAAWCRREANRWR